MKKIIIIILVLLGAYLIKIPEYRELNEIAIIEGMAIDYDGDYYTVYLKEVIPIKSDQGIDYEYKYYHERATSMEKAYEEIISNTKKKLYLKRCKFLVSNIYTTDKIINYFEINPNAIYHDMDNVYEKLKDTN